MAKRKKKRGYRGARPASRPSTADIGITLYQRGEIAFRLKDYATAVKSWRSEIRANPNTGLSRRLAEAHFRYALSMDRERNLTQIISELHQASRQAPDVAIYRYHLGLAYHQKKQHNKAIDAYQQALKLRPNDERFRKHLALACAELGQDIQNPVVNVIKSIQQEKYTEAHETLKQNALGEIDGVVEGCVSAMRGEYAKAKRQLNQYATINKYGALISYYLGLIYAQEGKESSAIKHLETAVTEPYTADRCKPILLGIYKQRAMAHVEAGEHTKANRLWNKIAQLDPQDSAVDNAIAASLEEGLHQASEGNFSQAMRSWRRLINRGVEHPALLQNYAIACDRSENYENAIETWQQLATIWEEQQSAAPDKERLKRKLGLVYRRIGEIAWHLDDIYHSRDAYKKALTYVPEDLEIRLRLVTLLAEEDDLNAAMRQLRQLRRRHPDNIRVLELEITLNLESDNYRKTLNSCLEILKLDPKHQKALELLESLGSECVQRLFHQKKHRQAIQLLQNFIEVYPSHTLFYMMLGAAFLEQSRVTEADRVLADAIEIAENKALALAQVGAAYLSTKQFDRAESYFKDAGGLDSEQPDVLLAIGVAYMPYDVQKANRYLNRLIASQPEDEEMFENIAQRLLGSGMPDRAREMINRGLKKFPKSISLLIGSITIAITMEDFPLARQTVAKARKVILAAEEYEALQALSAAEMMLTMREMGGFFNEFEDVDKPF